MILLCLQLVAQISRSGDFRADAINRRHTVRQSKPHHKTVGSKSFVVRRMCGTLSKAMPPASFAHRDTLWHAAR